MSKTPIFLLAASLIVVQIGCPPQTLARKPRPGPVLQAMQTELQRNFEGLAEAEGPPLYYLQYELTEKRSMRLGASRGALTSRMSEANRYVDVDLRVGTPELDSSHEIRDSHGFGMDFQFPHLVLGPVEDDPEALRTVLWLETDKAFRLAQERFLKVKASEEVKAEKDISAPDFAAGPGAVHIEPIPDMPFDREAWEQRVRRLSLQFEVYPGVLESSVELSAQLTTRYYVNTEGATYRTSRPWIRVAYYASTVADDGMELYLYDSSDARAWSDLPPEEEMAEALRALADKVERLRVAPVVEPYLGPAIMNARAAGVFFHEIFGHRMEGQRQKREEEGQTFARKVGEEVLAPILSVQDDATLREFNGRDLAGHYVFDSEGIPAQRVTLIENGILRGFLMSRSPLPDFPRSNGHGRRQPGFRPVGRQGNLIISASETMPYQALRLRLIEEIKAQEKPYGLIFDEVAGGFTSTQRFGTQSFKVIPLLVWKVYPDGRPDEMVRGVDIVGTPLASFSKVVAAADDPDVFNGTCGAESGGVPVSAISPSLLIWEIEVEKKAKEQDKPPILPAPAKRGGDV